MRRILDLPLLVILMGIGSLAMYLPSAHAFVIRDYQISREFFYSGTLCLLLTAMVGIATANYQPSSAGRSHLWALLGAYLLLPLLLAVPLNAVVRDTSYLNAWFEMVSSFTTTGATLYDTPGRLEPSIHLWRALVGWFGGFFVLLTAVAVLAPLNLGGFEVLSGGAVGRGASGAAQITRVADGSERVVRYATTLFPVYTGLTLLLWVGLLIGGDTGLVALCHAMSTLSTSGISPVTGLTGSNSGFAGEALIFVFFAFAITRRGFPGAVRVDTSTRLFNDPEIRMGLAFAVCVPLVLFLRHWIGAIETNDVDNISAAARALWGSMFTVVSFLTTTGFESADWAEARAWSGLQVPGLILIGLAMIGGGVATTAGGVKLLRVYSLYKHGGRELDKLIHPNSVGGSGVLARRLRRQGAYVAWIFFMLYALSVAIVMGALALTGVEFESSMIFAVAALSTTGPLATVAADAPLLYSNLEAGAKVILAFAMILGRLETLAILALFSPNSWRN